MVKVNSGYYGDGCHVIQTEEERILHQDKFASPDYFTQEMIPGEREYATHILIRKGKIVKSLGIEYIFDHPLPIKGQDSPRDVMLMRDPHLHVWESLLTDFAYEGLCCVNYKMKDGVPLLLEINPRFGGSLATFFVSFLRHFK
jgi:predicted ATP-grasp superfamily ATP-dependent carboligase